jgi:maleylpyruvate isomerase
VDAAQRELSDQVDAATQRLLDDARTLSEAGLRVPSLLPGWSRAHVLAHLARNADAMRNMLAGARIGKVPPAYASADDREADIARGAAMSAADLMADVADSAMALRAVARQLPDEAWEVHVQLLDSDPFPAGLLLTRRLVEVELHHCDLGTAYGPGDWSPFFAALDLPEPLHSYREDRLSRPQPAASREPKPPAPWKSGQPLPGSWLGRKSSPGPA